MAVDTEDRRRSAVNIVRRLLPIADNGIDRDDRLHVAGFYCCSILPSIDDDRKSSVNHITRLLPDPDGTVDIGDRKHVAGFYRGNTEEITPRRLSLNFYY